MTDLYHGEPVRCGKSRLIALLTVLRHTPPDPTPHQPAAPSVEETHR